MRESFTPEAVLSWRAAPVAIASAAMAAPTIRFRLLVMAASIRGRLCSLVISLCQTITNVSKADMTRQPYLSRSARRLRIAVLVSIGLAAALMASAVLASLSGATDASDTFSFAAGVSGRDTQAAAVIVLLLTAGSFIYALWRLSLMLAGIEAGGVFTAMNVTHLRAFARWLLVSAVASILLPIAANIGLGLAGGADAQQLSVRIDGGDAAMLLVSALLFFLARLFAEAQAIADENRQII